MPHRVRDTAAIPLRSALAKPRLTGHKNRWKKKRQRRAALTIKGKAYIAGIYEHPTRHAPDKSTAQLHAEVAKGALEDAGLTKADIDGYFCAGDAPGRRLADGGLPRPEGAAYRLHRNRRLFLSHPSRPCGRSHRRRQMLDRADHAGRQAAHQHDAAARRRRRAGFRGGLRRHHPQRLRHVRDAPYARLRHHQRATGLDQGRGLASRAIQSACHAEGRRHRRGRAELADDLRSAAPDGLLRRHRWRRRADRHHAGNRQKPEEAAGADDRPWRSDERPARRQGSRSDLFRRRVVRARARSRRPA